MKSFILFSFLIASFHHSLFAEPAAKEETPNKIIFLISPPRSISVGFLRMIEARGDFTVFHEPLVSIFNFTYFRELTTKWFLEGAYETYDQLKNDLFKAAESSNVFVKEMSFSAEDHFMEDEELMKQPNVYFVFLLRNPRDSIISYHHKIVELIEDYTHVVDYRKTYEIFEAVKAKGRNAPLVLFSEELAADPEKTIEAFCLHVQIPYLKDALQWKDLGENFTAAEWHESKIPGLAQYWHGNAIRSTGFVPLKEHSFEELETENERSKCLSLYEMELPYYQKMKNGL